MRILGIDTSGKVASVALTDDEKLICEKVLYTKLTHSQIILPMVKEVLSDSGLEFRDIDIIAVADGPGSYTGLRIGIAAVKGICLGSPNIKCAGISTLKALAYNCIEFCGEIISVMRARPGVVYVGMYRSDGRNIIQLSPDKVAAEGEVFSKLDNSERIMLTGDFCDDIKEKYFADDENVICAGVSHKLQHASSLCVAVSNEPDSITAPENLAVAYLQATKAEKDKAHKDM